MERCKNGFPDLLFPDAIPEEKNHIWVGRKFLYFLSWEELIEQLDEQPLEQEQCSNRRCDVAQLEGIRREMEGTMIDPFTVQEFGGLKQIAHRLPSLYGILEKVVDEFAARKRHSKGAMKWSPAPFEGSSIEFGLELLIGNKGFWLLPDFRLLTKVPSKNERSIPLFWLRIGFSKDWPKNKNTSASDQKVIEKIMKETSEKVEDSPRGCFSMLLPFEAGRSEELLVKSLVTTLKEFRGKLQLLSPDCSE